MNNLQEIRQRWDLDDTSSVVDIRAAFVRKANVIMDQVRGSEILNDDAGDKLIQLSDEHRVLVNNIPPSNHANQPSSSADQ